MVKLAPWPIGGCCRLTISKRCKPSSWVRVERGFRVLKSEIELAPVYHRLPQRIRAHAMICFMALILYRVMRQRLKMAQSTLSPERALAQLKRIHRHRIKVNDRALHGVSTLTKDQTDLLGALTLQKPAKHEQLTLL